MAVNLSPLGGVAAQFFNNDGVPLAGGLIYTYAAGTNTPSATYTTGAGTVAHSNPIVLDSAGRIPTGEIWLTDGVAYKFVIKDASMTLIGTYDNIVGINSNFVNYTSSQEIQTATAGQTLFTLTTMQYQPGTNSLTVFVDGVNQYGPGAQYAFVETSATSVTFASGLHVGASVKFTTAVINNIGGVDASQVTYEAPFANSVVTNVEAKLSEFVSVEDFGAIGDGITDDTAAVQAAIDTGFDVLVPVGKTFAITGNVTNFADNQKIYGGGTFKKLGVTTVPMFLLPDNIDGLWFDGIQFDGTSASFGAGNNVPAILGYITFSLKVTNCYFYNIIDVGIKLRDGANLYATGNRFYNIGENGIELHNYTVDVRTGVQYVNPRPVIEGNHQIIGNHFEKITRYENPLGPLVDACGIAFFGAAGYPQQNIVISNNVLIDCLRYIWTENNVAGSIANGVVITGNTMQGGVNGGTAQNIYGKAGIGIIAAQNVVISNNTFRNIANHNPVGTETACIIVSGSAGVAVSENVEIFGNSCVDDSGLADRTEWGIYCLIGTDIRIHNNYVSGVQNGAGIYLHPTLVTTSAVYANRNTESFYSWQQIVPIVFTRPSIAANQTVSAYPWAQTFDDAIVLPTGGAIVAVSAKLSTAITAGNLTIKTYGNGTEATPYQITTSDFAGGFAYKRGSSSSQPVIKAGEQYKVSVVTDASYVPANNVIVTVFVDIAMK